MRKTWTVVSESPEPWMQWLCMRQDFYYQTPALAEAKRLSKRSGLSCVKVVFPSGQEIVVSGTSTSLGGRAR
jgi:hypothetical protein